MGLLNVGLQDFASELSSLFVKGKLGTDGTAYVINQTDLQTEVGTTLLNTTVSLTDKQWTTEHSTGSTVATGNTFKEYGNTNSGDTITYNRIVITGLPHTSTDEVVIKQRFFVRQA